MEITADELSERLKSAQQPHLLAARLVFIA